MIQHILFLDNSGKSIKTNVRYPFSDVILLYKYLMQRNTFVYYLIFMIIRFPLKFLTKKYV